MKIKNKISDISEAFKSNAVYEFITISINFIKRHPKILSSIVIAVFIVGVAIYPLVDKAIGNKSNEESKGTITETVSDSESEEVFFGTLNINTATKNEFSQLPGINKSTAENIIEYRNNVGNFSRIIDIQNVEGITPEKYEKIKEYITIE